MIESCRQCPSRLLDSVEILVGQQFGPAEGRQIGMYAPPLVTGPQVPGVPLCLRQGLGRIGSRQIAFIIDGEPGESDCLIEARTHRLRGDEARKFSPETKPP